MEKKITVIKGDGIGPEIVTEAQKVLDKVAEKFGHKFVYTDILMGRLFYRINMAFRLQTRLSR